MYLLSWILSEFYDTMNLLIRFTCCAHVAVNPHLILPCGTEGAAPGAEDYRTASCATPSYVSFGDISAILITGTDLRNTIQKPNSRIVTMRDIAAAAKVSQTTVSLVLNKRESSFISDVTRDRVLTTARELGYRPNQIARALATGRTNIIGLWIRSLHSSYYTQLVHDLDELITTSSYSAIISRNTAISDASLMQEFPMMSVDGIIAVDIPEIIDNFNGSQIPIVSIGYQSTLVADSVAIELLSGTIEAMQHLYDSGRRRIALLIDGPCRTGGGDRMDGYLSFMREKELPVEFITATGQSHLEAYEAIRTRIEQGSLPDAVFCFNDDMALGASRALHAAGVRIPEDVALVGCDNIEECPYMEPPLSTIVHPRKEVCLLAWEFLQKRIADPDSSKQTALLNARFIARQSS